MMMKNAKSKTFNLNFDGLFRNFVIVAITWQRLAKNSVIKVYQGRSTIMTLKNINNLDVKKYPL